MRIAFAQAAGEILQGPQSPTQQQPEHPHQQRQAHQGRPEGMADDALDQILAQILALTDPDAQAAVGGPHQHPAPLATVLEHLVQPLGWHLGQLRRVGGTNQQLAVGGPDLKGQLVLVGVRRHVAGTGLHGLVEHPDQFGPDIRRWKAGLQQPFQ